ncbi:hydrolase TatD [Oleispira antarctica]|uniref:Hydrolase TatD n=1 Tax=Oleispira antarctica TaxID=188908 RepID=A0A1Y5HW37_OLEAN|nr:hydrolase TatD [Oleispira antarctica]
MAKNKRDIPNYNLPIIETHFHLDYLKEGSTEEILAKARLIGIEKFMTIAVSPDNLDKVISLTENHDDVYGTLGIHPHDAELYNDEVEAFIRQHLAPENRSKKMRAVGEIGLDYFYDNADRKIQRDVFERQLQMAVDFELPVVIHTREADEDTQAILANFAPLMAKKGVIHSFTSGIELARFCVGQGFNLGINGIVTFNKADNVREVVADTPIEKLLLETDAPFLTPVPYRGKENAPCYLPFIAERIAEVKGLEVEQVLKQCYQNSVETFFSS